MSSHYIKTVIYIVLGSVNLFSEIIVIMTAESVGRIPVVSMFILVSDVQMLDSLDSGG